MKYFLIVVLLGSSLFAQNKKWGWATHEYINDHAVGFLPTEMSFFLDHRNYIQRHATDPDRDSMPGYYHYIDIDYYPEFFSGTFATNMDSLIALYDLSIVEQNGTIPWIIEKWTDSLSTLMANGQWDDVWQIAAELGHYVADSHQPLHLTINYNGQITGNDGIHSRYETFMIDQHLLELPLSQDRGVYWQSVIDSVFQYIEEVYPYVDDILSADDLATKEDPNYGTVYYNIMWQELEKLTTKSIHLAITDLASLWRTAWENAGSPLPLSISPNDYNPKTYYLANNYPNPFNPKTIINYELQITNNVDLSIYNLLGEKVVLWFRKNK